MFAEFLREYQAGRTPNPDVLCNAEIKFKAFLDHAMRLGAEKIATGHYARVRERDGRFELLKGLDPLKDQSYFLHRLNQAQLAKTLFPVGELPKTEVRRIAAEIGLPNAKKKDSTGICFIGERPFREFLNRYLSKSPGRSATTAGAASAARGPELLHAGPAQGHRHRRPEGARRAPRAAATTSPGSWRARTWRPTRCTPCRATTTRGCCRPRCMPTMRAGWPGSRLRRARTAPRRAIARPTPPARSRPMAPAFSLHFAEPQWAVTPGQSAVLYDGEVCLGGGVIDAARESTQRRPRQVHRPIVGVGGGLAAPDDARHADLREVRVHDVRAVAIAAHPAVHHDVHGAVAGGDVLAQGAPGVAGGIDARAQRAAARAGVREEVVRHHVLRVRGCGLRELRAPGQRPGRREAAPRPTGGPRGTQLVDARQRAGQEIGQGAGGVG